MAAVNNEPTFQSSFAVALMNTSPEEQVVDVSFEEVFRDQVWTIPRQKKSLDLALIRSFKGKGSREAAYNVYDLWEKDEKGEWGRNFGVISGAIRGVVVASHQTKVWKLVPSS